MKALLISGSPRENGNTVQILNAIARGFESNGYITKQIILSNLAIKYCLGEKSCYKTGECVHNDDVLGLVEEIFDSQIVVVASPSYWGDVTAQMKTFIDRCTPYCDNNSRRKVRAMGTKGVAIAIRAGGSKAENENLIKTITHFFGHLEIPTIASFTIEGIDTAEDLKNRAEILKEAYNFGHKHSSGSNCKIL
ncbi:MAG: flavodoxin family protein [Defluviitaleaceae bacterium]|nr:flavodoxin family protein [Defluviitaleaceae bacterium]